MQYIRTTKKVLTIFDYKSGMNEYPERTPLTR